METNESVRRSVSKAYAEAVSRTTDSCCGKPAQKSVAAQFAGYERDELSALPADAAVNSFGCGNPLSFAEVQPGDVVLDLGSGAGIDILLAGRRVGPTGRAIGVDMTDAMIAKARENIRAAGLTNVEVRKGLIEELPVESGSVDWVISNCVINLSPEKPRVFAELFRVLKPGGQVRISDIVVQELPASIRGNEGLYCACIAGAISEEEYLAGLRRAGLADVRVLGRVVYDAAALRALAEADLGCSSSELKSAAQSSSSPGPASSCGGAAPDLADLLAGRIWSVTFYARKTA